MQPKNKSGGQEARSFIETARREQIVQAAIETLAEVGYTKASFARVAARAGVSPGLISYHFSNKQDLMEQVVIEVNADMERAIEARAEDADGYIGVLVAFIEGFVLYCTEHPAALLAVGQIESAEGWAAEERERSIADIEELLRGGLNSGEFRAFDARLMSVTLLGALEAVPTELNTRPDTDARAYAAELAVTFALAVRKADQ